MSAGVDSAAVLRLTLSAPASTAAAASSSVRMPPPTASGMNSSRATARIVSASARRASIVAVMSRMTSSSIPSALYRRASAAGSPAERSPSKFTPLTTWPSRTSRHAMMRFESTSARQLEEVAEDSQADVARLLGMELHAGDVAALHDRRERFPVLGHRRRGASDRSDIAVREVHLRAIVDAVEDRGVRASDRQAVPPDVWNLDGHGGRRGRPFSRFAARAEPVAASRQEPQAGKIRR